jgi:hypothetical protein
VAPFAAPLLFNRDTTEILDFLAKNSALYSSFDSRKQASLAQLPRCARGLTLPSRRLTVSSWPDPTQEGRMPSSDRAIMRFAFALGLLLLPALYTGQRLEAQHPIGAYYEFSGTWCGDYDIDPGRARLAVLAALADMHMPVYQEGFFPCGSFLDTKTPDNFETRLTIVPLGRAGPGTQVRVRIGGFGTHRKVCARILDAIGRQLDAARRSPAAPAVVVLPAVGAVPGPPPLIIVRPGFTAPPALPPPPTPSK